MKLHDLFDQDQIMNLSEVLNTRIPIEKWWHEEQTLVGELLTENNIYHILLEPRTYPFKGNTFNFINTAFAKVVNGVREYGITFDKTSPTKKLDAAKTSKIVGAISNGLIDKLKDYRYDAIVMIAENNVEQRMRVYNMVARWEINRLGGRTLNNIPLPKGARATIIFSGAFNNEMIEDFVKYIGTLNK